MASPPRHWLDWVAPDLDSPPPGSVGNDRDGAMVYFGCRPWIAEYEGQQPGEPPMPVSASRHDPATCEVCGRALTDPRVTCAGCLQSGMDSKLNAEVVRDQARAEARAEREAATQRALNYAQRKYGRGD